MARDVWAWLHLQHMGTWAHGHMGTRAHGQTQGKEVAFIHEDKDASDEWGVAQIYKLPGGCHK